MTREEIFYATLQELANEGNQKAAFALSIATKVSPQPQDKNLIIDNLKKANMSLQDALGYNDDRWTKSTDHAINRAQNNIINAISLLA